MKLSWSIYQMLAYLLPKFSPLIYFHNKISSLKRFQNRRMKFKKETKSGGGNSSSGGGGNAKDDSDVDNDNNDVMSDSGGGGGKQLSPPVVGTKIGGVTSSKCVVVAPQSTTLIDPSGLNCQSAAKLAPPSDYGASLYHQQQQNTYQPYYSMMRNDLAMTSGQNLNNNSAAVLKMPNVIQQHSMFANSVGQHHNVGGHHVHQQHARFSSGYDPRGQQ